MMPFVRNCSFSCDLYMAGVLSCTDSGQVIHTYTHWRSEGLASYLSGIKKLTGIIPT